MNPLDWQRPEMIWCPEQVQHQLLVYAKAATVKQMQHQGQCLEWQQLVADSQFGQPQDQLSSSLMVLVVGEK